MDGGDGDKAQEAWETKVDMIRGENAAINTILKVSWSKVLSSYFQLYFCPSLESPHHSENFNSTWRLKVLCIFSCPWCYFGSFIIKSTSVYSVNREIYLLREERCWLLGYYCDVLCVRELCCWLFSCYLAFGCWKGNGCVFNMLELMWDSILVL